MREKHFGFISYQNQGKKLREYSSYTSSRGGGKYFDGGGEFKTKAPFFGWIEKIVVKASKLNRIVGN